MNWAWIRCRFRNARGIQSSILLVFRYSEVHRGTYSVLGRKQVEGVAFYMSNRAVFKKRGLDRRTILHEVFHHLANANGLVMPERTEEKEANDYARQFLKRQC